MKPKFRSLIAAFAPLSRSSLIVVASFCAASSAHAASQTWNAVATDGNWATATNWSGAAVPGGIRTGNANNADVATFSAVSNFQAITIDANRFVNSIPFTTGAGAYTFTGGLLYLSQNGSISIAADVTNPQVFGNDWRPQTASSTNGIYSFTNNATDTAATLTFNATAITLTNGNGRPTTLTLGGTNTGENVISSNMTNATGSQGVNVMNKNGAGTWVLSGANTFTYNVSGGNPTGGAGLVANGIQINAGTLVVANNAALGNDATANRLQTSVNNTGTLQLRGGITLSNGVSLNLNSGGTIVSNGSNSSDARVNLSALAGNAATLSAAGASDVFTIGNGANDLTGGAADTVITVGGLGMVFSTQSSTGYLGQWSIGTGTLKNGSATNGLGVNGIVAFANGSTGKLQLGNNLGLTSLTTDIATPTAGLVEAGIAGTQTLTLTNASANTFGGTLQDGSGALALTKAGAGTLTLSGNTNSYTGGTIVSGGVLNVTNTTGSATGTGAVTVGGLTTLGGAGFISGAVTVNSGGTLAPGNSVGTLTVGSLTLDAGSKLDYEFGTFPSNDLVSVTTLDGLTINGGGFTLTDAVTQASFSTINTYNVIGYSGTIGGTGVSSLSVLNPQVGRNYIFGSTASFVTLKIESSGVISDWNVDASGSWNGGNWSGVAPNGVGQTGNFSKALTTARTVTLDGNKTLGGISFNGGASPLGYTIAPGSGGTLFLNNGANQANIIVTTGANIISSDVSLDSANTVAAVAAGSSLTISGGVGGTGSLVKSGLGLLDLTNVSNGYDGNTNVTGGTLGFSALGSLGDGNLTLDGGTLRYNAGNTADISGKTITLGVAGGTIDTNGNDVVFANAIGNGGAGGLTKDGAGKLSLAAGNTYSGPNVINGGTLAITDGTSLGSDPGVAGTNLTIADGTTLQTTGTSALVANRGVVLSGGTATLDTNGFDLSIAGNISGSGLLRKISAGNLTLTGTSNVTANGGTTVEAGTVFTNSRASLPGGTIVLNGSGGISNGSAAANYSDVSVNGTNFIVKTGTNNILGLGNLTGNGTLTFGGTYVNDYTGDMSAFTGTIIANGGGGRWNGSTGSTNLTLDLVNTGSFVRSSATGITIGALAGTSTATLSGSGGGSIQAVTYTLGGKTVDGLGVTPVDSTFNGAITNGAGGVGIIKEGDSSLTLGGLNTYTRNTVVNAGKLFLADNAQLTFKVAVSGSSNSISGSGQLKLNGDFNLDLTDPAALVDGSSWTLVDVGSLTSTDANPIFDATFNIPGFTEVSDVWTKSEGSNNWTFTESTGVLSLMINVDDYATWIGGFTFDLGADLTATGDPDGDGMNNQQEYAFGLIPNSGSSVNAILTQLSKTTGKFSYTRRTLGLPTPPLVYTIKTSTTLSGWTTDLGATQTVTGTAGDVETVEVTLSPALLSNAKLFVRVEAE